MAIQYRRIEGKEYVSLRRYYNLQVKYKELEEENRKLKAELETYKKQYKHSMGEDYIDEDLYDLDC